MTYNTRDFMRIAAAWQAADRQHAGIVVSPERPVEAQFPRFLRLFELYAEGFPSNLCMQLPPLPQR